METKQIASFNIPSEPEVQSFQPAYSEEMDQDEYQSPEISGLSADYKAKSTPTPKIVLNPEIYKPDWIMNQDLGKVQEKDEEDSDNVSFTLEIDQEDVSLPVYRALSQQPKSMVAPSIMDSEQPKETVIIEDSDDDKGLKLLKQNQLSSTDGDYQGISSPTRL